MRSFLPRRSTNRKGAVTVQLALVLTSAVGFTTLAVDMGMLYVAKAELQRAADAAAMAAANELMTSDIPGFEERAFDAAYQYALKNAVLKSVYGVASGDVVLGTAALNEAGKYQFVPNGEKKDAVRVTVRREEGAGGPISLAFAGLFGVEARGLSASATAMLIPRDVAVVIDLSNSMGWDSQLRFRDRTDGGYANTRDVWCALDGPEPAKPYVPGSELETEYAADTGPTIGVMSDWGQPLVSGYSASSDTGLWYLKKGTNTTSSVITASLTARGYNSAERSAIMSAAYDGTTAYWQRRAAVMLGLANWNSGKTGGFPGGNGDNKLDSSEVVYIAYPSWRVDWTWTNYIDWVQSNSIYNNTAAEGASEFRYRYGLKTFTDFLLENQPENHSTNNLWQTPELPLRPVKDAVQTFVNVLSAQDRLDHVSLEIFATTARHEVDLTDNLQTVADVLYQRQCGHYDRMTNIGGGLQKALAELTSARARPNATKMIILMSDGVPNIDSEGNSTPDGSAAAVNFAYDMAQAAADAGCQIFCISVGYQVDRSVLIEIANIGNGLEFHASGSPEEYQEELEAIFRTLGGKSKVALIE